MKSGAPKLSFKATMDSMSLKGIRVLDLGRVLAAPWAGQILGDLGADVIKVERVGTGDDSRETGVVPTTPDGAELPSSMFLVANRNKRSIAIDFKTPRGAALVRRLAAQSDIIVENFLPGSLAKVGLDYASLIAENPRLIYCSITGYGQEGPSSDKPGYDGVFQAEGGLMSVTGLPDGVPGGGPMKAGPSVVDVTAGYIAVIGILAALRHRDRTGRGQLVDTALLDAVVSLQSTMVQTYLASRRELPRNGTMGNGGHPSQMFRCADGFIYVTAGRQAHYAALCRSLGLLHLITDPRFATGRLRLANREAWNAIVAPIIADMPRDALLARLTAARVPSAPVATHSEVFADPQIIARGLEIAMENPLHPDESIGMLASPVRLSDTPITYRRRPPRLGEHTDEILAEIGCDAAECAEMRKAGIVAG